MRFKLVDKVTGISVLLLVLFAWADSKNLVGIKRIDAAWQNCALWDIFWEVISPAWFTMWVGVLIAVAVIYYIMTKKVWDSVAVFVFPFTLILFGVQDLIYYVISTDTLKDVGCWAEVIPGVNFVSNVLGEVCPTGVSLVVSSVLGVLVAYGIYQYLLKRRWLQ